MPVVINKPALLGRYFSLTPQISQVTSDVSRLLNVVRAFLV